MSFTEGEFKELVEFAPLGLARVGLDGTFLEVNPGYERITGYSSHELKCLKWQDITPPGDRHDDEAMVAAIIAGDRSSYEIRKSYNQKDNGIVPVALTVKGCYTDAGQLSHFLVACVQRPHKVMMSHGSTTVSADTSKQVRSILFGNWKWILAAIVASITTLSAWLASIEATRGRVERNENRIERIETSLEEILRRLPDFSVDKP